MASLLSRGTTFVAGTHHSRQQVAPFSRHQAQQQRHDDSSVATSLATVRPSSMTLPDDEPPCSSGRPHAAWVCRALVQNDPPAQTDSSEGAADSREFAIALAKVADESKCSDIVLLDVAPLVSWTSFMLVCSVFSKPQMMAVLSRMEKLASEEHGKARNNLPGSSPWEALDFGDVIVHIFTAEQREYYDIESFYAMAAEVELPFAPSSSPDARPAWTTKA